MTIHNLPIYVTPFIGRYVEIDRIMTRLRNPDCRLLTLVGPGGIGKTRLMIQVVKALNKHWKKDSFYIPLQSLSSPDFIVPAVADAIGFRFGPGIEPDLQLLNYLKDQNLLLLLDNFEHLLEGGQFVAEILRSAPMVCVIATSRERLNLREEWIFDVRELGYPRSNKETDIEAYDAVKLFVQHARRLNSDFSLTSLQIVSISRICQLVGGMPLGIELAANWTQALSVDEIADEIAHSLDILQTSTRNIVQRHRSIRAAFNSMWDRLSDQQQNAFKKISVFRGGFTRDAAQSVAGASLQVLLELINKSLIRVEHRKRYDLHELLRQYAEEHLQRTPDEFENIRDKHCRFYLSYVARQRDNLRGSKQKHALDEIQQEIDNIREAWHWAIERGYEADIGNSCHALWFFYDTRGWYQEGEQAFRSALESREFGRITAQDNLVRGRLLAHYGRFEGNHQRSLLEESVEILRQSNDKTYIGFALLRLSEIPLFHENDPLASKKYLEESLTIFTELNDWWGKAYSLRWLGFADFFLGEYTKGEQLAREALTIYQRNGDQWGQAISMSVISFCLVELGQFEEAKEVGLDCIAICEEIGLKWAKLNGLVALSGALIGLKAYQEARDKLYELLVIAVDAQLSYYILASLEKTASIQIRERQLGYAPEILKFIFRHTDSPLLGKAHTLKVIKQLEIEVSQDIFAVADEQVKQLSLDRCIESCMEYLRPDDELQQILNERELQILEHIAKGLSNRQIAKELLLSVGTIKWYNHQIYTKLNVRNRTQAVARARNLKLLH